MKQVQLVVSVMVLMFCGLLAPGQQMVAANTNIAVPPLVSFSGTLTDDGGKPISGSVIVTFSLYSEQSGGAALWMESQTVQADNNGRYTVMLGATSSQGLPTDLFASSEARWLGVQAQGEAYEQPRVYLVSVPYAMKAGDAATIGGLPPSAFVLAAPIGSASASSGPASVVASSSASPDNTAVTGSGTINYIPLWDSTSDILSSVLYQSGSGSTALIGINTTTPATTLDVKGTATLRGTATVIGTLSLPATGTAKATGGKNSEPLSMVASAYNSSTDTAVNQKFQWQAEAIDNDTSTASGTMNLLYGQGTNTVAETGLHIASNGQITFAAGQTFPGTGDGTITGVTAGTGLTGGGSSGSVTLNNTGVLGVTAGTGISVSSGQTPTIGINTSVVPQLGAANTFVGNQAIAGNLTDTGNITATGSITGQNEVLTVNNPFLPGLNVTQQQGLGTGIVVTAGYTGVSSSTTTAGGVGVGGNSVGGTGVQGTDRATSGSSVGVSGETSSSDGYGVQGTSPNIGVYGQSDGASQTGGNPLWASAAGVWGDTGGTLPDGVLGTADDSIAGEFLNNGGEITLYVTNLEESDPSQLIFIAQSAVSGDCDITAHGDLSCSGTVSGVVQADGGARKVSLYAMQSSENWFEDAGSGQLANGSVRITLDPTFAQTVNTGVEYHVFLTPKGDCEGLFVSNETPEGFEVRELHGGRSSIAFDYRIMAKRVGYENQRLEDVTRRYQKLKEERELRRTRMQQRRAARATTTPVAAAIIQPR